MKKTIITALILALLAPAITPTPAFARDRALNPLHYKGSSRQYKKLMEFINRQVEEKGLRGTEMVAERKKQQRAFVALSQGERRWVKKALKTVCTKKNCDYAAALFEYQRLMDKD